MALHNSRSCGYQEVLGSLALLLGFAVHKLQGVHCLADKQTLCFALCSELAFLTAFSMMVLIALNKIEILHWLN